MLVTIDDINMYLNITCLFISFFCFICILLVDIYAKAFKNWCVFLFLTNTLTVLFMIISEYFEGNTSPAAVKLEFASVFLGYVFGTLFPLLLSTILSNAILYSVVYTRGEKLDGSYKGMLWGSIKTENRSEKLLVHWKRFLNIVVVVYLMAIIINIKTGFIYYINGDNNFVAGSYRFAISAVFAIILIFGFLIVYIFRKHLSTYVLICIALCLFVNFFRYFIYIFYQRLSLSCLANTITVMLIFMSIQMMLDSRAKNQEKRLNEMRVGVANSQIQPHFLFNALNTIYALVDVDAETAKKAISEFSDYLRMNIDTLNNSEMITFAKEIEHVKTYLWLEKLRFGERINIVYDIREADFLVPPLLIQPIVENAVRHGICKKPEGGTIQISSERKDGKYIIIISDDGVGFDESEISNDGHVHIGISNSAERTRTVLKGNFELKSKPGEGTVVKIEINAN